MSLSLPLAACPAPTSCRQLAPYTHMSQQTRLHCLSRSDASDLALTTLLCPRCRHLHQGRCQCRGRGRARAPHPARAAAPAPPPRSAARRRRHTGRARTRTRGAARWRRRRCAQAEPFAARSAQPAVWAARKEALPLPHRQRVCCRRQGGSAVHVCAGAWVLLESGRECTLHTLWSRSPFRALRVSIARCVTAPRSCSRRCVAAPAKVCAGRRQCGRAADPGARARRQRPPTATA